VVGSGVEARVALVGFSTHDAPAASGRRLTAVCCLLTVCRAQFGSAIVYLFEVAPAGHKVRSNQRGGRAMCVAAVGSQSGTAGPHPPRVCLMRHPHASAPSYLSCLAGLLCISGPNVCCPWYDFRHPDMPGCAVPRPPRCVMQH
jgi:hypothetical protein